MSYNEAFSIEQRFRDLAAQIDLLERRLTQLPTPHFQDLDDADLSKITDGQVPMYDQASGLYKPGDVGGGGGGGGVLPAFWAFRPSYVYGSMDDDGVGGKWVPWESGYAPSSGISLADSNRLISVPQGWFWLSVAVHINSNNGGFDEIEVRGPSGFTPSLGASGADSGSMAIIDSGPGMANGALFNWKHSMSGLVKCSGSPSYLGVRVRIPNAATSSPFVTVIASGHWVAELGDLDEVLF